MIRSKPKPPSWMKVERGDQSKFPYDGSFPRGFEKEAEILPVLKSMGLLFEGGSPEFWQIVLPEGWEIVCSLQDHVYLLMDDLGRPRAQVYCRYDKHGGVEASVSLRTRYGYDFSYTRPVVGYIYDGEEVFKVFPLDDSEGDYIKERLLLKEQMVAWLDRNFPGWKNPLLYWD